MLIRYARATQHTRSSLAGCRIRPSRLTPRRRDLQSPPLMSDPYIQNLFAERIGGASYGKGTAVYKFAKIKRAKRAALEANPGAELIDMGVGEPDEMAFPDVIDELYKAAKNPDNRGYADNGGPVYQQAAARWLKNVCGVEIADPAAQIVHSIGSK